MCRKGIDGRLKQKKHGHHLALLDGEGIIGRRCTIRLCSEMTSLEHRTHIKLGKDAAEEVKDGLYTFVWL